VRTTLIALLVLGVASSARAELAFFEDGRFLSIKSHRTEDDQLVLTLRSGGELRCAPSLIVRIAEDEVPYPEPVTEQAAAAPAQGASLDPTQYDQLIAAVATQQGVDARLVKAMIKVESGYNPRARSPKGAMGLMQLMPETARQYHVSDPYDPRANIEAGIQHLKSLLARYPRALALAAYNAGESAVLRFRGIPPFSETRDYVDRILRLLGS
jgi:soluble lytic murein transglycosylase-like protein